MEMYTAAAAMRPYKLEKQIAFLLPHVSFRDEDDNGSSNGDEDTSSLLMTTDIKPAIDCEPSAYDQQQVTAEMLYEQSNMDKSCSEHEALDRSIHFLCDQRYKQAAATNYKWVAHGEGTVDDSYKWVARREGAFDDNIIMYSPTKLQLHRIADGEKPRAGRFTIF